MKYQDYYIGLDLGTNSVGWAALSPEYDLLRLKGKTAFGARIFSEAQSCKERRGFRSSGRRLQRRNYRIYLLNQLLAEDINKVDNHFFERLRNSHLTNSDRENKYIGNCSIFEDKNKEKDFYKLYPTIWHLRKALCDGDKTALSDIRNVYMALHHIIKYRGNFLSEGSINIERFDLNLFGRLNEILKIYIADKNEIDVDYDILRAADYQTIVDILENSNFNKTQKQKEIKKLFITTCSKDIIECFIKLITGGEFDISNVVDVESTKISFEKDFDSVEEIVKNSFGEYYDIVFIAKQLYDFILLKRLIGNNSTISEVMINTYNEHKNDLKLLKKVIIEIDKKNNSYDLYNQIFKDKESEKNYASLVHNNTNKSRVSLSDFNIAIGKILDDNKDLISEEDYTRLKTKIDNKKLLERIANISTSVIPHQLHQNELLKILENAEKVYSCIKENKEKFVKIFLFRVPYYCGPLDTRSKYSNVERISNETITPWNVEEIIDFSKTKQKFMNKLTMNCSYLYGCGVLPKSSLTIEDFLIYDRLNVMKVNNSYLSSEEKEVLYKYIVSRNKTTINNIKKYLINITGNKEILISNIKEDVPFEATSHSKLSKCFNIDKECKMLERCILLSTIYADDKRAFVDEIKKEYPQLNDEQIKCIKGIIPKKWARLSKELLCDTYYVDDNGICNSIIDIMKGTNKNFQMILNDKEYNFLDIIKEKNYELSGGKTKADRINDIMNSIPAITRRSVNQALLVIDDIVKAAKCYPKKIIMEVTRHEEKDKKETISRKNEISMFLNSIIKDAKLVEKSYKEQANSLIEELNNERIVDLIKLKGKHLYLYFKQLGYDMYTGDRINIEDVLNSNMYDIDHIIPQSLIKDDSLDNTVLVSRHYNQNIKKDYYPIPLEIKTQKVKDLWEFLFKKKFISEKKYSSLIRNREITVEELEDFVNRQINVVDYSNIAVKNILEEKYGDVFEDEHNNKKGVKIIFSKAHYPNYLRKTYKIVKNRDLNDAHHAVDAYLNGICGDILSTRFNDVRTIYALKKANRDDNEDNSTTFNMENVLLWEIKHRNLISKIKNNCFRHDALVTYKTDYNNGAFYKQTMYKAGQGDSLIPIHTSNEYSDTSKYGGYSQLASSRMSIVEYEKNNKIIREIITRKILFDKLINKEEDYLKKILGKVENPKIICDIALNQKIKYDGGIYLLYTKNENQLRLKMAYQNYLENNDLYYLSKATKLLDNLTEHDEYYEYRNKEGELILTITKEENENIFKRINLLLKQKVYDSCNYLVRIRDLPNFEEFNIKEQIEILNNLVSAMSRNADSNCKLKKYYSSAGNPILLVSKNITKNQVCLINESPTGLFTHQKKI